MPLYMNASDCLLHPSAGEGSPNVVKEALACNLPAVATPEHVAHLDSARIAERIVGVYRSVATLKPED